jgi:ElaB/YqjD/DUF883 family membrane-anchored ribosome-binding protein
MSEQNPRSRTLSEESESGETSPTDQAKEYAEQAKNRAGEVADQAKEKAETGKEQAASGLERTAQMAHERAAASGGMPAEAGAKVADMMEDTAKYLRTHDTNEIWSDVESYARSHPVQTVVGAVIGGFVLGRLIS